MCVCNSIGKQKVGRSCALDLALPLAHGLVNLLAHEAIDGGGRCHMAGILPVSTGLISPVCKQTGKTYLWRLALTCGKGRTLHSLCYFAAVSLLSVNTSYHGANA